MSGRSRCLLLLLLLLLGCACSGPAGFSTPAAAETPDSVPTTIAENTPQATETAAVHPSTPIPQPATPTARPTSGPTPTPTVTPLPSPTPVPMIINGMTSEEFFIMPPETVQHMQEVYAHGQTLGRNPRAFSTLGDSLVVTTHYLSKFDTGLYKLGDYAYLQPVINHFYGSFSRFAPTMKVGLHAWAVFDPFWAEDDWCEPGEHMLECEFRLHNPAVLFIRLGTNDDGPVSDFELNVRNTVLFALENGVIPVLGTKADRHEGEDNRNNLAIRRIAADLNVPLWDFDLLANTLPYRGITEDNIHLTIMYEHDYTDPEAFNRGYPVNDLSALMVLQTLLAEVMNVEG